MKIASAIIKKSITLCKKLPYVSATSGSATGSAPAALITQRKSVNLILPRSKPNRGVTTSATKDETILPKAEPITTPYRLHYLSLQIL